MHRTREDELLAWTEPKLKAYLEVRTDMAPDESLAQAESRADVLLDQLEGALRAMLGLDDP